VRLAHGALDTNPYAQIAIMWKEEVERRTDKVAIHIFGNRQLGDDKAVLEGAVAGTVDAALASTVLVPLVVGKPSFDALQLPFLVNSYDNLGKMLVSRPAEKMLASLSEAGLQGIAFGEGGQRHFLNKKGPVEKLVDFKGLKARIVPVPLHKAMWERVGTNPVGVAYGEVYTSLQTNVIDALETNLSSLESENFWEVAKHMSLTGHYFWPGIVVYNKRKFDALPEDVRKVMMDAGRAMTLKQVAYMRDWDNAARERLKAKGVTFHTFGDLKTMQKVMEPILAQWNKRDPLIGEYITEARKLPQ
jgi:TRAP-type transport system periplasmic protein